MGGSGGVDFAIGCNASEALVGIYGHKDSTLLRRIGGRCVGVDSAGRWIGEPVDRTAVGSTTGTSFRFLCPTNYAISGFKARTSTSINALRFECRALTPSGQVSGSGQYLSWAGGSGGNTTDRLRCASGNPGFALGGRAGGEIDATKLVCRRAGQ